ncbi:DNA-directed RNA polymerase subunit beta [Candidatus Vidania fulgoroideorum]
MIFRNFSNSCYSKDSCSIIRDLTSLQKHLFYNTFSKKYKFLDNIFARLFPLYSNCLNLKVSYCGYFLKSKNKSLSFCKIFMKTLNFSLYLRIKFSFFILKNEKFYESKIIYKNIHFCEIPYMLRNSSFIINGIERTVISQLYKNPIVSIENINDIYILRIIPIYGFWLEFYRDKRFNITISINNSKKIPLYIFLLGIGYPLVFLIKIYTFYKKIFLYKKNIYILYYKGIENLSKRYKKAPKLNIMGKDYLELKEYMYKHIYYLDVLNNNKITSLSLDSIFFFEKYKSYNKEILCLVSKGENKDFYNYLINYGSLSKIKKFYNISNINKVYSFKDFLLKRKKIFFCKKNFFLTDYSRRKLNKIIKSESSRNFIDYHDIYKIIILFKNNPNIFCRKIDKDSLSKKKIRGSGKHIENIFLKKISLLKRLIIKRISNKNLESSCYLINQKLITHSLSEFFCVSQYCQFLDQNNILSEITHKRRISYIGSNTCLKGSSMEELRKIHHSIYGRICPIETPEGSNIGLVNSFSIFSKVDNDFSIKTPYIFLNNRKIKGRVTYLKPEMEINKKFTSINNLLNDYEIKNYGITRKNNNIYYDSLLDASFMDVSSLQIFSLASMMIPFIEHDDVNRALMGSNMQRQGISGFIRSIPYVGTSLECLPFIDLKYSYLIKKKRNILYSDSKTIILKKKKNNFFLFKILDFVKYGYNNQKNIVNNFLFDFSKKLNKKYRIANDNCNTYKGSLALGHNILTAFLSFKGYNYEDSIIVSDRLVKSEVFSTLHTNIINVDTESSKGDYIYNRDIFYINKKNYKKINKKGFPKIGMYFKEGDVVIPRIINTENNFESGYDRLIKSILNKDNFNYKESFVRMDSICEGTLVKIEYIYPDYVKVSEGNKKNNPNKNINLVLKYYINVKKNYLIKKYNKKIFYNNYFYYKGKKNFFLDLDIKLANNRISRIKSFFLDENKKLNKLKKIKLYFIKKKRLSVGDKMSGRHGNKGVISKILPIENMPFLKDGTICDMILNPLGVPTRMNVGQVYELNMGFLVFGIFERIKHYIKIRNMLKIKKFLSSINFNFDLPNCNIFDINYYKKNITVNCLPFESSNDEVINEIAKKIFNKKIIKRFNINESYDKVDIFDGFNGMKLDNKASFGYMYFMKLHHTSYDKIHARSVGPYSLITQQPLKGKSNKGGQRVGEMEVWALEAYGASYVLREMLTVKSDDITSRNTNYNNIILGENKKMNFFPETFNILVNELKSLCISIDFI